MAENGGLQPPNHKKPTSIPKLFTLKSFTDTTHDVVVVMSPTSILDISKSFSVFKNPFWPEPKSPSETRHKLDTPKGIGLVGIVDDALKDTNSNNNQLNNITPETRPILFGSRLRIQIPPLPSSFLTSPSESPISEFGVKITNSNSQTQTQLLKKPVFGSEISGPDSPMVLSASEMELSEDYTCVITHGPNPKTTHIFDNCIVESYCGGGGFSPAKKVNGSGFPSGNFLSFCCTCKKDLGLGKDIYMYRGEKAFCSHECRYQEIMLEEEALGTPEI
ncbi:hypothetical protein ACFE04_006297 [Oxalis oulophora]